MFTRRQINRIAVHYRTDIPPLPRQSWRYVIPRAACAAKSPAEWIVYGHAEAVAPTEMAAALRMVHIGSGTKSGSQRSSNIAHDGAGMKRKIVTKTISNIQRARRNLRQSAELMADASVVIGARSQMAMGTTTGGYGGELARMVPEKVMAFQAAGLAAARNAARIAAEVSSYACNGQVALYRAAFAWTRGVPIAPRAFAEYSLVWAWWLKRAVDTLELGASTMRAQNEVTGEVHRVARANAKRLSQRRRAKHR